MVCVKKVRKMRIKVTKNVRNALQVIAGAGALALLVFATMTIKAPNIAAGLIITAFIYGLTVLSIIGIGVRSPASIAKHLAIATPVALVIGLLGGHFWAGEPWELLLSENFFTTTGHIAFIVGVWSGSIADARTK